MAGGLGRANGGSPNVVYVFCFCFLLFVVVFVIFVYVLFAFFVAQILIMFCFLPFEAIFEGVFSRLPTAFRILQNRPVRSC